jgi:peptidoglycan/LPS O-acetylase OafA/YrhL
MSPDQEARLTLFVLVALYFFLVFDALQTVVMADRVVAYMLMTIVAVLLVGALVVKWEPRAMSLLVMIAAVLQAFGLGVMLTLRWRDFATAVWLSSFLTVALLYVSRRFRAADTSGRGT